MERCQWQYGVFKSSNKLSPKSFRGITRIVDINRYFYCGKQGHIYYTFPIKINNKKEYPQASTSSSNEIEYLEGYHLCLHGVEYMNKMHLLFLMYVVLKTYFQLSWIKSKEL